MRKSLVYLFTTVILLTLTALTVFVISYELTQNQFVSILMFGLVCMIYSLIVSFITFIEALKQLKMRG